MPKLCSGGFNCFNAKGRTVIKQNQIENNKIIFFCNILT